MDKNLKRDLSDKVVVKEIDKGANAKLKVYQL